MMALEDKQMLEEWRENAMRAFEKWERSEECQELMQSLINPSPQLIKACDLIKERPKAQMERTLIIPSHIADSLIDPVVRIREEAMRAVGRYENGAIENILRRYIDNPIVGPITKEALQRRCVRTILYKEPDMLDCEIQTNEKEMKLSLKSLLLGVVQGDYLIGVNGERSRLTDEQQSRLFRMGI